MPPLIALTNNFSLHDTTKWTLGSNCTLTNETLVVTPDSGYSSYYAINGYDMTGKGVIVQILSAPSNPTSPGSSEGILGLDGGSNNTWQYKFKSDGSITPAEKVSNVTTSGTTMAWAGPLWLCIRESGGTVYWDYSYDCITWTNQWSKTWAIPSITSLHPQFMAGYFAGSPSGTATFDNFNLPSPRVSLPFFESITTIPASLQTNLIGRYEFNGNGNDSSSSANHGTKNGGITVTADRHGGATNAFLFNGSNAYISAAVATTATTNVALSAWFKSASYTQDRQGIIYNGNGGGNGYGILMNQEGMNTGQIMILYGGVSWYATGTFVTDTNWHHIVLNVMSDGHPEVYLDGSNIYTGGVNTPNTPSGNLGIGTDFSGVSVPYFNGSIDDVKIYSSALSGAQITALYNL